MHRFLFLILLALPLALTGCRGTLVIGGLLFGDDDDSAADDDDQADDDDVQPDDDDVQPDDDDQADDDDVQPDDDDVQPDDDDVQPDDDDAVGECPDDGHEPNDTQNAASSLPEGSYDMHVCLDHDWYEVCWDEGDQVDLLFFFDHDDGDIDVGLHTPTGELIYESNSGDDNEGIAGIQVPFGGCRYVHVYLWDDQDPGGLGIPYELVHEVN